MKLLSDTALGRARIAAFIDGDPIHHGRRISGLAIRPPASVRDMPAYPILIASILHEPAITRAIRHELGLPNRILTLLPPPPRPES